MHSQLYRFQFYETIYSGKRNRGGSVEYKRYCRIIKLMSL